MNVSRARAEMHSGALIHIQSPETGLYAIVDTGKKSPQGGIIAVELPNGNVHIRRCGEGYRPNPFESVIGVVVCLESEFSL
jgi:hypothetical protein